jgi:hypothetical protein
MYRCASKWVEAWGGLVSDADNRRRSYGLVKNIRMSEPLEGIHSCVVRTAMVRVLSTEMAVWDGWVFHVWVGVRRVTMAASSSRWRASFAASSTSSRYGVMDPPSIVDSRPVYTLISMMRGQKAGRLAGLVHLGEQQTRFESGLRFLKQPANKAQHLMFVPWGLHGPSTLKFLTPNSSIIIRPATTSPANREGYA